MSFPTSFIQTLRSLWLTLRCPERAAEEKKTAPADGDSPVLRDERELAKLRLQPDGSRTLFLPDLFASIMSVDPPMNKHFEKVKPEAEEWIIKTLGLSGKEARKIPKFGITYIAGIWAPYADEEAYRTMIDWLHWVFYFDDQFDEGDLKDDPVKASAEVSRTLAILSDDHPLITVEEDPLSHVFQSTWLRFKKRASPALQARYKSSMAGFCDGLLGQVDLQKDAVTPDPVAYMEFRRLTIGAYPCHELIEYCHCLDIPQKMIDHPSVEEIRRLSVEFVFLHNDILSYRKDLELGVKHNMIHVLCNQGLDEQQAVTHIGEILNGCFRRWYNALAQLPVCGESTDRALLQYVWGCQCVALGNLHWSFMTGRYLGPEGDHVRATRMMHVPKYD